MNLCEKVAFIALKDTKELSSRDKNKQSVTKEKPLQGGVGEGLQIRRISVIRELFERVRTEPKVKEHISWVLSSRQPSLRAL